MLEFLGLEQEANRVLICFALIGFSVMLPLGCAVAWGDTQDDRKKYGGTLLLVLCAVMGIGALIAGIWPGIVLFFTFQWKYLIWGVILALLTGAVGYALGYLGTMRSRKRSYRRNPIMKEAVDYCRQNNIVAVQCFEDRIRFFRELENPGYCEPHRDQHKINDAAASQSFQKSWQRPADWQAYDCPASFAGAIVFAQRDWPKIPDLRLFAKVLAKQLGGCSVAAHFQSVQYDTEKWEGNTHITTHHITNMYFDCFVYKKAAYRARFGDYQKQQKEQQRKSRVKESKGNVWE